MTNSNAYGFYPDRTKYNLEDHLALINHKHTLADIEDYHDDDTDPLDSSLWENGYVDPLGNPDSTWNNYSIILKEASAIPVEAGETYLFDLNTGYQGRILFYDGNGDFVYQLDMDDTPQIYPVAWTAPADGTVRFVIQKMGVNPSTSGSAGQITPADIVQAGLEFKPSSLTKISEILAGETKQEYLLLVQQIHLPTANVDKWFAMRIFRRGHIASVCLNGWTDQVSRSHSTDSHYRDVLIPASGWKKCRSYSMSGDGTVTPVDPESTPSGLPEAFKPANPLGDNLANSAGAWERMQWVNQVGGDGTYTYRGTSTPIKKGDMLAWAYAKAAVQTEGTTVTDSAAYFICSFVYHCLGDNE